MKFFGKNRYKLPVYYSESYPAIKDCNKVGPEILEPHQLNIDGTGVVTVVLWEPRCGSNSLFFQSQANRLKSNFEKEKFIQYLVFKKSDSEASELANKQMVICGLLINDQKEASLSNWECDGFLVMIDWNDKIRGYYSGSDFEDIDRLILELNVIKTIREDE